MQYKKNFVNEHLDITIYTNSKRILKIIENVLDLNHAPGGTTPKIKLHFYLSEENLTGEPNKKKFIYSNKRNSKNHLRSTFGKRKVEIDTDRKKGITRGFIYDYDETIKDSIAYLTLMKPLRFILPYYGFFFLHAAAVSKDNKCVLISGPQGCGKSTLSVILAYNGYHLFTDDDCYIKLVGNEITLLPFPTKIGLSDKIIKRYPGLKKNISGSYRHNRKHRISAKYISAQPSLGKKLQCTTIIFPEYKANAKALGLRKLKNSVAIKQLANESPSFYAPEEKETQRMLLALWIFTKQAKCFKLSYNDKLLDKIPDKISKIL